MRRSNFEQVKVYDINTLAELDSVTGASLGLEGAFGVTALITKFMSQASLEIASRSSINHPRVN